ncbi:MAG: HPr family phosphocarrier protein [Planctomycetota bacterium]
MSVESNANVHEGRAEVRNLQGMHFRPVGLLAQLAQTFKSAITLTFEDNTVDAKSALALTMLGAPQGAELAVRAEGPDAEAAVTALVDLINNRFGLKDTD